MNPENATLETLETKKEAEKINGIEVKSLSWSQIQELRKLELDPTLKELTTEANVQMIDFILDKVYGNIPDIGDMPYDQLAVLAIETYKKAYGRDKEIKN